MTKYQVKLEKSVIKDLKKIKHSGLKNKFDDIMNTLKNNPYKPTHSFEKLVPRHEGYYLRRLNIQHRIVYKIDEKNKLVTIYSAWTHYEK